MLADRSHLYLIMIISWPFLIGGLRFRHHRRTACGSVDALGDMPTTPDPIAAPMRDHIGLPDSLTGLRRYL